jgi:hypothetical protein
MADWATVAELGTAAGTLVLAFATFASVRSANRSARVAERSLMVGLRPLILASHLEDPPEKIGYQDDHWIRVPGGHAHAEVTDEAIYLAIAVRNVGSGLGVLNGWSFIPGRELGRVPRPDVGKFRLLTRDLYVAASDHGFWQGAYRDPSDPAFAAAAKVILNREVFSVDLLYGDGEGGQGTITRFFVTPGREDSWFAAVSHHWYLDRPDPR